MARSTKPLWLTGDPDADALLDQDPNALLIGMVLDQQIPMEKAFSGPRVIAERMGGEFSVARIAALDPERFVEICQGPPAVHRFPGSMGGRVQDACRHVVDHYDGDIATLYASAATGTELLKALKQVPGFGEQKAKIFLALLGKQRGVTPQGWREAAGDFGEAGSFVSVADIVDEESLQRVRAHKKEMKAAAKAAAGADPKPARKQSRRG